MIKNIKKVKIKKLVKKACSNAAFEYLVSKKGSKMENLNYDELKTCEYLLSKEFNITEKKLLFKLRTRMIAVAANFGNKSKLCSLCLLDSDNQEHLVSCFMIKGSSKTLLFNESSFKYRDIFSSDINRLKEATKIFYSALKTRDIILDHMLSEKLTSTKYY